ncbi:hypothetical protein VTO73DRAFT_10521 [Trametes versicolor]
MLLGQVAPAELRARGSKPLVACLAVQDDGPLLGLWTLPYEFEHPDGRLLGRLRKRAAGGRWSTVAGLLGGVQYNQLVDVCWSRYERWSNPDVAEDPAEATLEVAARIQAWAKLKNATIADEDSEAREVALDWGAKIACMLAEEWEVRAREGVSGYKAYNRAGRLPWQRMMKEVMHSYNQDAPVV